MKVLVLGQAGKGYSIDNDLLIDTYCLYTSEEEGEEWEEFPFITAFPFKDDKKRAEDICKYYSFHKIKEIYPRLNEINGTNYPFEWWYRVLKVWLNLFIQFLYDRESTVKLFIEKYQDEECEVTINNSIEVSFEDGLDFYKNGTQNTNFNAWVIGQILKKLKPNKWLLKEDINKLIIVSNQVTKLSWSERLKNRLRTLFPTITVYGVDFKEALQLEWLLFQKSIFRKKTDNYKIDIMKHSYPNPNIEFSLDVDKLIFRFLPKVFKKVKKHSSSFGLKRYNITGPQLFYFESFKMKYASQAVKNGTLFVNQHGSNYGTASSSFVNIAEYDNPFITWGWNKQNDYSGNFYDLPSPLISKLRQKRERIPENELSKIVLVGTIANLFFFRFDAIPQPTDNIQKRKDKLQFIKALSKEVKKEFWYRPYLYDIAALKDKSFFIKRLPDLKILEGDLHHALVRAKLIVLDNPGTTFNLALGANIPLVGFWNENNWGYSSQAQPYYDKLKVAKVIFDSAEEAAQHINTIKEDIQSWWMSKEVQDAVSEWSYQYARTSDNWFAEWKSFIKSL